MRVECSKSVVDPVQFIIKDCASRHPSVITATDVNTALADLFGGFYYLINRN